MKICLLLRVHKLADHSLVVLGEVAQKRPYYLALIKLTIKVFYLLQGLYTVECWHVDIK